MSQQEIVWNRMVPELTVTDFAASLNFYVEVLGFRIIIRRERPDFVYLALGDAQLMLEHYQDDGWNTAELIRPFGRGVNFQIEVDDIVPLVASLQAHAIPLYRPLRDNYYRVNDVEVCQRECLVQDPDGYLLRFSQYIE